MPRRRAMTSAAASTKKVAGHEREHEFAALINGKVHTGDHTGKKDVVDKSCLAHSVKGGKVWQIFLYRRSRFVNNTEFQGIGDVTKIAIECIDAFPSTFAAYEANKPAAKAKLQIPMRKLCAELNKSLVFAGFIQKAFFNGNEVDYLTVKSNEKFHVFASADVVDICKKFNVENSKARKAGETDDLKVLLKFPVYPSTRFVNIGEIEMRNDSDQHYQEVKFRINAENFLKILQKEVSGGFEERGKIIVYGKARKTFKKIN